MPARAVCSPERTVSEEEGEMILPEHSSPLHRLTE